MKKITIKALLLSLLLLSAPKVECATPVAAALGYALFWGVVVPVASVFTVGFVGGAAFVGYKVVKHASSKKKVSKEARAQKRRVKKKKKGKKIISKKEIELESLGKPEENLLDPVL